MADSEALRSRRRRLHQAGNHALCKEGRCDSVALPDGRIAGPGSVEQAVLGFLSLRPFKEGDPRGISAAVAARLARVVDQEGSPLAARELVGVCKYIAAWSNLPGDGDFLDELNAQGHVRALDAVMASLQQHMSTPVWKGASDA
jgi:hypothetical protein